MLCSVRRACRPPLLIVWPVHACLFGTRTAAMREFEIASAPGAAARLGRRQADARAPVSASSGGKGSGVFEIALSPPSDWLPIQEQQRWALNNGAQLSNQRHCNTP